MNITPDDLRELVQWYRERRGLADNVTDINVDVLNRLAKEMEKEVDAEDQFEDLCRAFVEGAYGSVKYDNLLHSAKEKIRSGLEAVFEYIDENPVLIHYPNELDHQSPGTVIRAVASGRVWVLSKGSVWETPGRSPVAVGADLPARVLYFPEES